MPRSNREQLIVTAELLRPLLGELVFVGGAVTTLLVTDEGAGAPRPTMDVDAIAGEFGRALANLGVLRRRQRGSAGVPEGTAQRSTGRDAFG